MTWAQLCSLLLYLIHACKISTMPTSSNVIPDNSPLSVFLCKMLRLVQMSLTVKNFHADNVLACVWLFMCVAVALDAFCAAARYVNTCKSDRHRIGYARLAGMAKQAGNRLFPVTSRSICATLYKMV